MVCSSFNLAYPSSFYGVFYVSSTFAMIVPIEWREQIIVQVRIHPSGMWDDYIRCTSSICSLFFLLLSWSGIL